MSEWYKKRFNVDLQQDQVVALLGSKEGIANIARAFVNPGDRVLVPDPAYPVYANGSTILCDGKAVSMPLLEENGFQPDFDSHRRQNSVKMMFINYPNNPTAATVDKKFLKEAVDFAKDNNIILCYDNAYSEITYDGYRAPASLKSTEPWTSPSNSTRSRKTFNMTGDRIGFAVGNKHLVAGLTKVKSPNRLGTASVHAESRRQSPRSLHER